MMAGALQVTLTLLGMLALILGAAWLLRYGRQSLGVKRGPMHIEATLAVGPRERVVLMEVGGQWLLLGVAQGRVNTLAQLPQSPLSAQDAPAATQKPGGWLATYLKKSDEK